MTEALVITGGSRGTLASAMPPKAQPNPCGIPAVGNAEGTSGSYPRRMSGHRNNQPTTERELLSKNGEQKPAAKRRRVSKACDRCHQGKLKCNGALPRCGTCAKGNKTCSYASGMKRRGLRTGYVRALEGLWGLIFQSVEGSEELVESLVESTRKNGFWTQEESDCGWSDGETPWARWKSSSIPQAIDDILCNTSDRAKNTPTEPLKLTAKWGPFDPLYPVTKPMIHQGVEAVCHKCAQRSQSQANAMNPAIPGHVFQYSVPELPSKPVQILNRYFALTHSWLPIVDRHAMYRSLFLFKQLPANSGEIAALWALLAHASMTLNASGKHQRQAHEPDICYMAARRAIPIEREDRYSVGHIQALLILALSHYAALECKVARTVVAQAILLARHIGLDEPRNCEQDTHLRTWLACFVIDTLIAMHTRSAPHMRSEDVKHHPPIEETANEEWEPWDLESVLLPGGVVAIPEIAAPTHSLSVFSRLVDLMCIANDCASSTTDEDRQQPMNALLSWTRSLPDHIRSIGDSVAPTTCWPPNVLNLYTIHAVIRRSICPFSSPEMKGELKSGYYWQMVADGASPKSRTAVAYRTLCLR
ncbi:hypothetical protein BJY01DRAFT_223304, partial [Aspergillus pseudoustus]